MAQAGYEVISGHVCVISGQVGPEQILIHRGASHKSDHCPSADDSYP